jgi:hypothetical protein
MYCTVPAALLKFEASISKSFSFILETSDRITASVFLVEPKGQGGGVAAQAPFTVLILSMGAYMTSDCGIHKVNFMYRSVPFCTLQFPVDF